MQSPKLIFTMQLADSKTLLYGNLRYESPSGENFDYIATSGCAGWQSLAEIWERGRGAIPPGKYEIPTKGYHLPTKGIEGMFYHITPDPVVSPKGIERGEFGIHFDANLPGSAGCIVLKNKSGFKRFCERMDALNQQGIKKVSLIVNYS